MQNRRQKSSHRFSPRGAISSAVCLLLAVAYGAFANPLDRDRDPVLLTGADLPALQGLAPDDVAAFRWEGGWVQVPVQIDERTVVDFGTIYGVGPTGFTVLTYTDAGTFTGPDPDPLFDADDELALLARDAGGQPATGGAPTGTLPGSGVELAVTDPLGGGGAWLYLFAQDGSLDPGAGGGEVVYDFVLLAGDYLSEYDTMNGPNPENSTVTTPAYSVHFADRWIRDETAVTTGGAGGADILDRHRNLFAPGNCIRSEDTFSNGEGAFIVNRSGPVRALRAYVGANSGPTTHRLHFFYPEREDIVTVLRVHAIPGILDIFDYSPDAIGMRYHNDLNPAGVEIDGEPDAVVAGDLVWEMVTGGQGTVAVAHLLDTDIPGLPPTSYYLDDAAPQGQQCTGDDSEYGAGGPWFDQGIPNTDPGAGGELHRFVGTRALAYGGPDRAIEFAEQAAQAAAAPLAVVAAPYSPATGVAPAPDPGLRISLWPNPSRGAIRIVLSQRRAGPVQLRLFDLSGRQVAILYDGHGGAGEIGFVRDLSGLPAGLYLLRVRDASGRESTERLLLMR